MITARGPWIVAAGGVVAIVLAAGTWAAVAAIRTAPTAGPTPRTTPAATGAGGETGTGGGASGGSAPGSGLPGDAGPAPIDSAAPTSAPAAPPGTIANLRVAPAPHSVALSWAAPSGADLGGFIVQRLDGMTAPAVYGTGVRVAVLAPAYPAYTDADPGFAPGGTYSYAIFTLDSAGRASVPAVVTVTLPTAIAFGSGGQTAATVTQVVPAGQQLGASGSIPYTAFDPSTARTVTIVPASGAIGSLTATTTAPASPGAAGTLGWTYTADNERIRALPAGATATDRFRVILSDGTDAASTDVVITLVGVNDAPAIPTIPGATVTAASGWTLVLPAPTDPDTGDRVVLAVGGLPAGVVFDPATRTLSGTGAESAGTSTITVTARDAAGVTATTTFPLSVAAASPPPAPSASASSAPAAVPAASADAPAPSPSSTAP